MAPLAMKIAPPRYVGYGRVPDAIAVPESVTGLMFSKVPLGTRDRLRSNVRPRRLILPQPHQLPKPDIAAPRNKALSLQFGLQQDRHRLRGASSPLSSSASSASIRAGAPGSFHSSACAG